MIPDHGFWHELADHFSARTDSPLFTALLILYSLCFLDVLTTILVLMAGGSELNPLMVAFAASPVMHLLLKWLFVFVVYLLAAGAERSIRYSGLLIMGIAILYYSFVVLHNAAALAGF